MSRPIPQRIQLRRTKGWRKPPDTVVVSRPSRWGNPFSVVAYGPRGAVRKYRRWLQTMIAAGEIDLGPLRGKNLACWCAPDAPCHADVLLDIANQKED